MHQDESRVGNGPGGITRLVRQNQVEVLGPDSTSSRGLETNVVRGGKLARCVLHQRVRHLVLLDIGILHVTNGVGQAAHKSGHAFVALATGTHGPIHRRTLTHLGFPLWIDLAEIVGEDKGGARTVSATHWRNGGIRQRHRRIQRLDGGIAPIGDLAQIDVTQHLSRQLDLTRIDALDVDHRHHTTNHGRELHQTLLFKILVLQGHVGGTERHGLGINLAQTSTRAHRLIVDPHASGLVVVRSPLGIQRRRKRGASARNLLLRHGTRKCSSRSHTSHQNTNHGHFHEDTFWVEKVGMSRL